MDTSLAPEERAQLLVDALTLDQKIQQIAIVPIDESDIIEGCEPNPTARTIEGIPELALPTIRMTNGGTGVKGGSCLPDPFATGLPSFPAMAATFDRASNYQVGEILGVESYAFAHQVMLAPGLNLIRLPYAGRAFEYPTEDPYLAGAIGVEQVRGIQDQGIQAQVKHLAFNEQELERWTAASIVPARAAHELYLLPFEMAIKDGEAASAMCSFPDVNGTYACENEQLLRKTLEDRWGFDGWIMTDRRAAHSTVPTIKAGVDVELGQVPGGPWGPWYFRPDAVHMALDAGRITEADLDEMLLQRYTQMFKFGQFEDQFLEFRDADLDTHGQQAREIAEKGVVLLKNEGDLLPLDGDVGSIALIGPEEFAGQAKLPPRSGNDIGETVVTPYTVTPQEGLERVIDDLGADTDVTYNDGRDIDEAVELAEESDVVVLMVGDLAQETQDKPNLLFPEMSDVDQEELIDAVVGVNENTVVVLKTSGMMLMPWLDEVPALVEAWYPGQEDGNVVADVLYGVVNPSGKLPVTFGNSESEAAWATDRQYPGVRVDNGKVGGPGPFGTPGFDQLHFYYDEDLEMGYRWYEANDVTPTFEFGYGLSYTTFAYSGLSVTPGTGVTGERSVDVTFTVTNTGDVAGTEAAQVYLTLPDEADEPGRRLVGFERVELAPGASQEVSVTVDSAASNHPFSYWVPQAGGDWADGDWATPEGGFTFHVGTSSLDTSLEQDVDLTFPPAQDEGDIPVEASIPDRSGEPGSLTLRIEAPGSVDLGVARRQVDRFRFDGDLPPVVVTDTRNDTQSGGGGWSVTGSAAPFENDDGDEFSASHLGWYPWTTAGGRPGVTPGPEVLGVLRGGPGLAEPATLVSATSDGRRGAATAGAHLLLEIPLDTPPGQYDSSIHLSLFPVD